MWFRLRPVDVDFLERAGRVYVMEGVVRAPRPVVWSAIVDPSTWRHWFPGVEVARYRGAAPHGVGSVREARVGGQRYEEVMVAWQEAERWAYSVVGASVPLARAQLECTELEDCPEGTRVRWTLAADRRLLLWLLAPFLERHLQGLWSRALRGLELYLGAPGRRTTGGGAPSGQQPSSQPSDL